jgi:arginine deiminase
MTLHVDSEVGRLVRAIEHRRGVELSRLTPAYADGLRNAFAAQVAHAGVPAHHLGDPLSESLAQSDGRELLQDREPGQPVDNHEEVS